MVNYNLTDDEVRLLQGALNTWECEGCPNVYSWDWNRENKEEGRRRITEAHKGIKEKIIDKIL